MEVYIRQVKYYDLSESAESMISGWWCSVHDGQVEFVEDLGRRKGRGRKRASVFWEELTMMMKLSLLLWEQIVSWVFSIVVMLTSEYYVVMRVVIHVLILP